MRKTPSIETERLLLRKMRSADMSDFMEYFTNPDITPFLGGLCSSDPETAFERAAVVFRGNCLANYTWAIELKSNNKVIGDVHFGNIIGNYLAHIGYVLNIGYWGKGYAQEAISAIVNYGFSEAGFERIRAITQLTNTRSQKVLEKCGFKREALIHDCDFYGEIDDLYYYSKHKYDIMP